MNKHTFSKIFHGIGRYWFVILIVGYIIWTSVSSSSSSSTLPPPTTANVGIPAQASFNATNNIPSESFFDDVTVPPTIASTVSLPTGTVIKSRSYYLSGDGELEISNGTNSDALAKLITGGTSIYTVYIKANSTYTMKNITNGTYWLAFALGTDWDATSKSFNRPSGYSSFDESFDFTTRDDGEYIHYSRYRVTLNPVAGGTAETSDVNASQFDAY